MRGHQVVLIVALVLLVGAIIRVGPLVGEHWPGPANFSGTSALQAREIAETGHFLSQGHLQGESDYSRPVEFRTEARGLRALTMAESFAIGLVPGEWSQQTLRSLATAVQLLLPLLALMVQRSHRMHGSLVIALSAGVVAFTPAVLFYGFSGNAPVGWLILLNSTLLIGRGIINVRGLFALLPMAVTLPLLYWTPSLALIILWLAIAATRSLTESERRGSHRILWGGLGLYFAGWYLINISFEASRFFSLVETAGRATQDLGQLFGVQSLGSSRGELASYVGGSTSASTKVLLFLNGLFAALPVVISFGYVVKFREGRRDPVVIGWLVGLVGILGIFWSFNGSYSLDRIAEWGGLASLVMLACFAARRPQARLWLAVCSLVACSCATVASLSSNQADLLWLNHGEAASGTWLATESPLEAGIFTDLRLAANPIARGHVKTGGLDDATLAPARVIDGFNAVYYRLGSETARWFCESNDLFDDRQPPNLVYFSSGMSEKIPAIRGWDFVFKPAPKSFLDSYAGLEDFSQTYANGSSVVFSLRC